MKDIKMPSIEQFRGVIKKVSETASFRGFDENGEPIYDKLALKPKIKFTGTTKIHGTNASIVLDENNNLYAQKKSGKITVEKDNYGFAFFVEQHKEYFKEKLQYIKETFNLKEVIIYGEWAGKGIQKGVAVSEIEKTFFMFGIKFLLNGKEEYKWSYDPSGVLEKVADGERIRSIYEFGTFEIEIDFEKPHEAQQKIIEMVDKVENECPVGKAYGISGIGEGIIFVGWDIENRYVFKAKGDKHSNTKVKKIKEVDVEKENAKIEFANYATPGWRLSQMFEELKQEKGNISIKDTGDFIRKVIKDIIKEEIDIMSEKGLEPKEVNSYISKIASRWFREELDKEMGL